MNNVIDQLHTLLSASMEATDIKKYYRGEVVLPPKSYLPVLMIIPVETQVVAASTAKDQYVYNITIRIMSDLNKHLSENDQDDIIQHTRALIEFMEGRETDGSLKSDTVLGTLRENLRTDDFLFSNEVTIEYNVIQQNEFFYTKADLNFLVTTDLIIRP